MDEGDTGAATAGEETSDGLRLVLGDAVMQDLVDDGDEDGNEGEEVTVQDDTLARQEDIVADN